MVINNCIVDDGKRTERKLGKIVRAVVHRIDFSRDEGCGYWRVKPIPREELTGLDVAKRFMDARRVPKKHRRKNEYRDRPGAYTGGQVPYHFLIRYDGQIDQMLEVADYGPHARRWSWSAVGVAVAGDFRRDDPTTDQWASILELTSRLAGWFGVSPLDSVMSHTELPNGSNDVDKQCPGPNIDMAKLRWGAEALPECRTTPLTAAQELLRLGVVF